jgi:hypothetical protein
MQPNAAHWLGHGREQLFRCDPNGQILTAKNIEDEDLIAPGIAGGHKSG